MCFGVLGRELTSDGYCLFDRRQPFVLPVQLAQPDRQVVQALREVGQVNWNDDRFIRRAS